MGDNKLNKLYSIDKWVTILIQFANWSIRIQSELGNLVYGLCFGYVELCMKGCDLAIQQYLLAEAAIWAL